LPPCLSQSVAEVLIICEAVIWVMVRFNRLTCPGNRQSTITSLDLNPPLLASGTPAFLLAQPTKIDAPTATIRMFMRSLLKPVTDRYARHRDEIITDSRVDAPAARRGRPCASLHELSHLSCKRFSCQETERQMRLFRQQLREHCRDPDGVDVPFGTDVTSRRTEVSSRRKIRGGSAIVDAGVLLTLPSPVGNRPTS
jgi:hypothetical protein